ncbi:unnamed protein product [Brassicogethes aeneus]|uniref:Spaetzle domain-containing protein n=1 Tax=Brassicogethes aeneus TaxID=1431903 RepID=A0A9P0B0V7_BRAAE|nr:unnamed protein product [Brassicogethes aeneus]
MRSLAVLLALMMILTRLNGSHSRSQSHHFSQFRNTTRLRNVTNTANSKYKSEHQETYMGMAFPDPTMQSRRYKKTESCPEGLCEYTDDYPMDIIENFLESTPKLKEYFNGLVNNLPDINNRDPFAEEETLCSVTKKTVFPKKALNLNKEEKTIINQGPYKQGIEYDLCGTDGGTCKYTENFPENMQATCKQKYNVRRLMVYNGNDTNRVFDDFRVPSCCVCMIKTTVH